MPGHRPTALCSLMHGVAVQFLRSDWLLENLAEHDESKLPPWVRGSCSCAGMPVACMGTAHWTCHTYDVAP